MQIDETTKLVKLAKGAVSKQNEMAPNFMQRNAFTVAVMALWNAYTDSYP